MKRPGARCPGAPTALGPGPSDAALHAARIEAKRVRYAAEALSPAFGKRAAASPLRRRKLQDVLGEHQDARRGHGVAHGPGDGRGRPGGRVRRRPPRGATSRIARPRMRGLAEGMEAPRAKEALLDVTAEVRAAGGVVRRRGGRTWCRPCSCIDPRYDDWTFPKGKLLDGESFEAGGPPRSARGDGTGVPDRRRAAASRTRDGAGQVQGRFATG